LETTQPEAQIPIELHSQKPDSWKRFALDILETILLAVVLYVGINAVSARVRVEGTSMNPTLQNNEYVFVNRLAYLIGEPQRGDIIVFSLPLDEKQDLIKRVIGLPGETISIQNNEVLVNGVKLEEPYIAQPPVYSGEWTIGRDELFVLGDNRNASKDSHQWGVLPIKNVIGKAVLIYWPPSEWKFINHIEEAFSP